MTRVLSHHLDEITLNVTIHYFTLVGTTYIMNTSAKSTHAIPLGLQRLIINEKILIEVLPHKVGWGA